MLVKEFPALYGTQRYILVFSLADWKSDVFQSYVAFKRSVIQEENPDSFPLTVNVGIKSPPDETFYWRFCFSNRAFL
jgi:hypothetical protein